MPTTLPERSPLSALMAELHARDRLIEARQRGEDVRLQHFIVADWRCWRTGWKDDDVEGRCGVCCG